MNKIKTDNPTQYKQFITIFIFIYWALAWYFEQLKDGSTIDLIINWWNGELISFIMIATAFVIDLLVALLHFIPLGLGYYLAPKLIAPLLQNLYQFSTAQEAEQFLLNLASQTTNPPVGSGTIFPFNLVNLDLGELDRLKEEYPWLRGGYGGQVKIKDDHAVVTEKNGQFYRILSGGIHTLKPFEIVKEIIDLSRQDGTFASFNRLITNDGMPLEASIYISYQIAPNDDLYSISTINTDRTSAPITLGQHRPLFDLNINQPFSYSEQAVYNATYHKSIERIDYDDTSLSNESSILTWKELVPKNMHYSLNELIANYSFSDLISGENGAVVTEQLQEELHLLTQKRVSKYGVWISNLSIMSIQAANSIQTLIEQQRTLYKTAQTYHTHPTDPTYEAQAELIESILVNSRLAEIEQELKFSTSRPMVMNRLAQAFIQQTSSIPQLKIKYKNLLLRLQQINSHSTINAQTNITDIEVINNE